MEIADDALTGELLHQVKKRKTNMSCGGGAWCIQKPHGPYHVCVCLCARVKRKRATLGCAGGVDKLTQKQCPDAVLLSQLGCSKVSF